MKTSTRKSFAVVSVLMLVALIAAACAPTAAPTAAPATQAPAAPATQAPAAPAATPTVPPPNCTKMEGMPTVAAGALGSPENPIVMTFVPSGDVPTITKAGTEIADCLSKITGLSYKIEVGTNFAASIEAMGAAKCRSAS